MDINQQAELDLRDIKLIQQGGAYIEQGITGLFKRYYPAVYQFYRRNGLIEATAEDLVQDFFVKVVRRISDFRGDCPVGGWLWAIARNTLYDNYRDQAKHKEHASLKNEDLENQFCYSENTDDEEVKDCVKDGFNQFAKQNNERAQALMLISFNGWGIGELAQYLERTQGATREYVSQCRKKLRPFIVHCLEIL